MGEPRQVFRPAPAALAAVAALAVAWAPIPALEPRAHATLAIIVLVGGLWVSEALPVAVAALLVPPLAILLGVADARAAFAGFGDPIVFMFLGTFLLIDAAFQFGLGDRLANAVLGSKAVQRSPGRLLWMVALLGCSISAWVNNTATTALLLPLALTAERFAGPRFFTAVLLMTSYAPSIGGLATPVGTAPNLIGLRLLEHSTGSRPSFAAWCATFAPFALLFTALSAGYLRLRVGTEAFAAPPPKPAGPARPWSSAERLLVPVFTLVVLLWIAPGVIAATPLGAASWVKDWQARLPEPAVPLIGGLLLFLLPSGRPDRSRILDGGVFRRIDWSTLLLFGGGLTLGGLMLDSGLARALGEGLFSWMPVGGTLGIVAAATILGVLVSEFTSNTASASLVIPVVLSLAQAAGVDPRKAALAATAGCSFGFMLPVSTPPNALVYGTGKIRIIEMVKHGLLLDVAGVIGVAIWVTLFG